MSSKLIFFLFKIDMRIICNIRADTALSHDKMKYALHIPTFLIQACLFLLPMSSSCDMIFAPVLPKNWPGRCFELAHWLAWNTQQDDTAAQPLSYNNKWK